MLTFLGWTRVKQGRSPDAKPYLIKAINLKSGAAPAHCLQAQALEQEKEQQAKYHWEQCLRYGSQTNPDEDNWIGLARKSQLIEAEKILAAKRKK